MGKRGPKGIDGGLIYAWACDWFRVFKGMRDGIPEAVSSASETRPDKDGRHTWDWAFSRRKAIPAEPQTLNRLLNARTRQDVIYACEQSSWWLHPRYGGGPGSPFPPLPKLALAFLRAKRHPRYPSANRPSSEEKRLWFLSVALAAKTWKTSIGRAINLLQESSLRKPAVPKWWKEIIEETGGVMELEHPDGNYYTDGHRYWRVPAQSDGKLT